MEIIYSTDKSLPCDQLHNLFVAVGWSDNNDELLKVFNKPFIGSDIVISAWDNKKLIGCIRAISDKAVRSVIYDLAVLPDYQNHGIGRELLNRCINTYPNSEWVLSTTKNNIGFYKKIGFQTHEEIFLRLPSKWF